MSFELTEKQRQVVEAAKAVLKKDHGLDRVCLEQLPSDAEIERDGVEEWVATLVIDTCYWEGTWP